MLIRLAVMAAALGVGALVGRQAINKNIEKRLPAEIEAARELAVTELDKTISRVLKERLGEFTISLLIKAGLVGAVYMLYAGDFLTGDGIKIVVPVLIVGFIVRDLFKTVPFAAPAIKIVRMHRWNARRAVVEFVAGVAFERAYAETMIAMESGRNRYWIALSKYSSHNLSNEDAEAVADVARTASFDRAKGRILLATGFALVMFSAYAAFFFLTIGSI